ncbi:MAG: hypothetical protein AAGF11_34890 [Myxococcota bacterium]
MANNDDMLIAAVRSSRLVLGHAGDGFVPAPKVEIIRALNDAGLWIGPRGQLERDPSFRQLIPYIVMTRGSHVAVYRRAVAGGEERLHGRWSLGLGGHVELGDLAVGYGPDGGAVSESAGATVDLWDAVERCAHREMDEEIRGARFAQKRWIGFLADDSTEVSRVHLGIVGIWTLMEGEIQPGDPSIGALELVHVDSLTAREGEGEGEGEGNGRWERWSALLLEPVRRLLVEQGVR